MRTLLAAALFIFTGSQALAENVISELSRRTLIPELELNELLSDCQKTQLAMNICAARDSVAADMAMNQVLTQTLNSIDKSCHRRLQQAQARWEKFVSSNCNQEANAEAAGGSMRPMVYNSCVEVATMKRTKQLETIKACKNVR